jgi:CubicO group peptidase (beta-lactamase class C family)
VFVGAGCYSIEKKCPLVGFVFTPYSKYVHLVYKHKTMKKILLLLCTKVCLQNFLLAQTEANRIDSLITAYTGEADFTGSVLVAKGGQIVLKKSYGWSNAEKKTQNDGATVFNIASVTKTFTAAIILKLQEKGKLSVHEKLSTYYPNFPHGDKITIHHLLTHTSGIFNYTSDAGFRKMDQSKELHLEEMIALFKDKPLQFEPGTKFSYCNSGYTLLGYIIEKVTGTSYATALQKLIFKPLSMSHTTFGPPDTMGNKLAQGYMMHYKNFTYPSYKVHPSISYATGAIYSTVEDLYKWHKALQSGRFLSQESLNATYKYKGMYGYGWYTDSLYGKQRLSHDGNIAGYKSNINRVPQDDVCVIALSNANNSSVGGMVRNIMNILYQQPFSKSFADQSVVSMPDSAKKEYTGVYKFRQEDSLQLVVRLADTRLLVSVNKEEFEIQPVNKNQFKAGTARVEFTRNAAGQIEQLFVYRKGEIMGVQKIK